MNLIVKKFGGTSLADISKISQVADRIKSSIRKGQQLVVVVSAMAGETDNLESLAYKLTKTPNPREFDVLLSSGEQISIALLAIALTERGCLAKSYTGAQASIITDKVHGKARVINIDTDKIQSDLDLGYVVIVAGFQGVDENGNITTLGRGGSDTTAVAIASAMKAKECQIYTDVDGIFTTDPKIVPTARCMERISFEEMMELSSAGAKVLQIRAVEFAGRFQVPVRVLPTFNEGNGTLIGYGETPTSEPMVSSIAFNCNEALVTVRGIKNTNLVGHILEQLTLSNVEIDMMTQPIAKDNEVGLFFMIPRKEQRIAKHTIESVLDKIRNSNMNEILINDKVAKISVIGIGMRSHTSIISKIYNVLNKENVTAQLITTSEIKVSIVIDEEMLETIVRILHETFNLGKKRGKDGVINSHMEYEIQAN